MTRALISVSNKEGLVPFVEGLTRLNVEILSTGGTKRLLEEAGIKVKSVSDVTGFPEILDGRVKTLHPNIHGGLLARRDLPAHLEQIQAHAIEPIDLVVVNLYPFKETISKSDVSHEEAVENIDIGGPSMIRSAAKNYEAVTIVCDPTDYEQILQAMEKDGGTTASLRARLAAKAFRHTAAYDAVIAEYLTREIGETFPEQLTVTFEKKQGLRYGENPHQEAAFYASPFEKQGTISGATQRHGKELSYNNIRDTDAALQIVKEFSEPAVVAVKHMNPCGIGIGETIEIAFKKAYAADPVSIFGGIVAANRVIDEPTAAHLSEIFLEIIIAPGFTEDAFTLLSKKKNIRLLTIAFNEKEESDYVLTSVQGGLLIQDEDRLSMQDAELTYPTDRKPTEEEMRALQVAWKAVKHVKSNAIVLAKEDRTIGIGAGQMNRVGAAKIAIDQAGELAKGAVMASDAFFPMPDTVEEAAKAGVTAIIQPGGSVRDQDSIDKANELGIAMVFTGVRHFKH